MKEKDFESILSKYPELIEEDLKLLGRQLNVAGKFIDLLFEDKHRQKLIIELKVGPIVRKDIGQVMDYEGYVLSPDDPTIRIMLIGNRVPMNLRRSLDHHGIEWKEIPEFQLASFLSDKGDMDFLGLISEEHLNSKHINDDTTSTDNIPHTTRQPIKMSSPNKVSSIETSTKRKIERGSGSVIDVILSSLEEGFSSSQA